MESLEAKNKQLIEEVNTGRKKWEEAVKEVNWMKEELKNSKISFEKI